MGPGLAPPGACPSPAPPPPWPAGVGGPEPGLRLPPAGPHRAPGPGEGRERGRGPGEGGERGRGPRAHTRGVPGASSAWTPTRAPAALLPAPGVCGLRADALSGKPGHGLRRRAGERDRGRGACPRGTHSARPAPSPGPGACSGLPHAGPRDRARTPASLALLPSSSPLLFTYGVGSADRAPAADPGVEERRVASTLGRLAPRPGAASRP